MACRPLLIDGKPVGIVCSRGGRRGKTFCACGAESSFLCDFVTASGRTCDRPLCVKHTTRVAAGVDHCPDHVDPFGRPVVLFP